MFNSKSESDTAHTDCNLFNYIALEYTAEWRNWQTHGT